MKRAQGPYSMGAVAAAATPDFGKLLLNPQIFEKNLLLTPYFSINADFQHFLE